MSSLSVWTDTGNCLMFRNNSPMIFVLYRNKIVRPCILLHINDVREKITVAGVLAEF